MSFPKIQCKSKRQSQKNILGGPLGPWDQVLPAPRRAPGPTNNQIIFPGPQGPEIQKKTIKNVLKQNQNGTKQTQNHQNGVRRPPPDLCPLPDPILVILGLFCVVLVLF